MNKFNKNIITGTAITMTGLSSIIAYAQPLARCGENFDVWVTASSMYIKASANPKSINIGSTFKGEHFEVIGQEGDYYKIAWGPRETKIGYILKQYTTSTKPNFEISTKNVMKVNTNNLNMRYAASTASRKLGKLNIGDSVELANSSREINFGGYTWVKCKAIIKPNGDVTKREFYVAKKYLTNVSSNTPETTPEVKPEVSTPEATPEVKPEVSTPEAAPETEKPQVELAPLVTEESITIVADGDVVDVEGNVLLSLKKGDKVTLTGEKQGIDTTRIELNNGSFGIIKNTMVDADFHTHEEGDYVHGRPCNPGNLGQSMDLVEYIATRDLVAYDSDCKYFSKSIVIPKDAAMTVAKDFYNPTTGNIQAVYRVSNDSETPVYQTVFIPVYQFK